MSWFPCRFDWGATHQSIHSIKTLTQIPNETVDTLSICNNKSIQNTTLTLKWPPVVVYGIFQELIWLPYYCCGYAATTTTCACGVKARWWCIKKRKETKKLSALFFPGKKRGAEHHASNSTNNKLTHGSSFFCGRCVCIQNKIPPSNHSVCPSTAIDPRLECISHYY